MKLRGKRTGIGFVVGTLLVAMCIFYSREDPQHFSSILVAWVGVFGVFVGKNLAEGKIKKPGGEDEVD
jgi:hypothetical protein